MLRSLALIFVLLLAMPAAAQAPGTVVKDCPECPEMVVVPAGYTRLASGGNVRIEQPFLVGKFEVTLEEYDACIQAGACACCPSPPRLPYPERIKRVTEYQVCVRAAVSACRDPEHDPPFRTQPVIDVSWQDAQDYIAWLSKRTGKAYRLLSEAEWEYAAQAGTGREAKVMPGVGEANCNGCGSRWDGHGGAPVGSFRANAFGLHDMLGNVYEWTADCDVRNESHAGPPRDGSARTDRDCSRRVLRGGSYIHSPHETRSAYRFGGYSDSGSPFWGFRVARAL